MSLDFKIIIIESNKELKDIALHLFVKDYSKSYDAYYRGGKDLVLKEIFGAIFSLIRKNSIELNKKNISPENLKANLNSKVNDIINKEINKITDYSIKEERKEHLEKISKYTIEIIFNSYKKFYN